MGFHSIRWRVLVPNVVLILLGMILLSAYAAHSVREASRTALRARLMREAHMVADNVWEKLSLGDAADLASQVSRFATLLEAHITVFSSAGNVLADSHDPRVAGGAWYSPEVRVALGDAWGSALHADGPLGDLALYVAIQSERTDGAMVIVRLGTALDLRANTGRMGFVLAGGLLIALAVTGANWIVSKRMLSSLSRLTMAVENMAQGDLYVRLVSTDRDEIGRLVQVLGHMRDRLLETISSLDRERIQLAGVLDNMADGVLITDDRGRVQLVNPAAARILGIAKEKALGLTLAQAAREHRLIDIWRSCHESGEAQVDLLETGPRRPTLQVVATPLPALGSGACLIILQDVSQVRHLEATRREFVSNISHELRTPLASMRAVVDTLRDGALEDPPVARRFLDHLDAEIDALTQMVQELLELSRIESGQVPMRLIPISVPEVVEPPIERLRLQAEREGLSLQVELPDHFPQVLADAERIQQVLTNLLHNAIKFTPAGGHVRVTAERQGNEIIVSVRDTGVGIPQELLPRIFERFFKADRARATIGTGLGLAIAKHIVQAHGGRIWVESVEGRGSTFSFSLLIAGAPASPEASSEP